MLAGMDISPALRILGLAIGGLLAAGPLAAYPPIGGVNSAEPKPPPPFVLELAELASGDFAIRVPTGRYEAPPGGAPAYRVPGPVAAFRGPDGAWRGHGYLETYPRVLAFEGTLAEGRAELAYRFEDDRSYRVVITSVSGGWRLEETSDLGPRNLFVFDTTENWRAPAGLTVDGEADHHAFLTLPCYYDKPEVTIRPVRLAESPGDQPALLGVLHPDPRHRDVLAVWMEQPAAWTGAATMGAQLWQRRQHPGDPSSRHFLGPETKSDSTPNPRTAELLGTSLYEGRVTFEFSLGRGTRTIVFGVFSRPEDLEELPDQIKARMREEGP